MFRTLRSTLRKLGFTNTESALRWDITRMRARMRTGKMLRRAMRAGPLPARLHFGCGSRKVAGWLNCDIQGTDVDLDLAAGRLPFAAGQFEAAAAQHVIEHLALETELRPLLAELHRCLKPGGELWLSCPDMAKVCGSYMADRGAGLMADRQTRWPRSTTEGYPDSQVVNYLFHQGASTRTCSISTCWPVCWRRPVSAPSRCGRRPTCWRGSPSFRRATMISSRCMSAPCARHRAETRRTPAWLAPKPRPGGQGGLVRGVSPRRRRLIG